jgi:hypothetical protein
MSKERNIASQRKATEYLSTGEIDAGVDTWFTPRRPGRDGFREFFQRLFVAFPDLRITPEVMVADVEHLALAYTLTGHHRGGGDFHGVTAYREAGRGPQGCRSASSSTGRSWSAGAPPTSSRSCAS